MTSALAIQVRKEARALLPWWLGVAATTIVAAMLAQRFAAFPNYRPGLVLWVAVLHGLGVLALAALSLGQEVIHGTLPALLVQPIGRLRMLSTKLLVLVPAVAVLGLVTDWLLVDRYVRLELVRRLLVWAPVIAAIGLVPLLTLLTRKPLGGVVFSIAIPGLVLVAAESLYSLREGTQAWSITWYGTLVLSAAGVIALFHQFQRLEAAGDGSSAPPARLTRSTRTSVAASPTAAPHWVWLAAKKELRLQPLTCAVSGLYAAAATLVAAAQHLDSAYVGPGFLQLAGLHGVFIAIVAGSIASAEERHLGTLASQVLLPRAAWRQWMIKAGVTLGLTAVLAIGLPALLTAVLRPVDPFRVEQEFVVGIVLLTCGALYVSSLSSNSLWALLATFPALAVAFVVAGGITLPVLRALREWFPIDHPRLSTVLRAEYGPDNLAAFRFRSDAIRSVEDIVTIALAVGVGVLALYFAARNHRSLDRNVRTIANQVAGLALYAVGGTLVFFVTMRIAREYIR